ncbi:MAG: bifunctional adenosylcobinamide kinase/adenosylcobinamide-phosphate guanylyltransferase [Dehalococcoidia bacterium]|nr:bifunctional adenosylcobinamide kinase/adenosylcobinamide-phosphate guanylyltransferase [Dehalococcoidia bacterium]
MGELWFVTGGARSGKSRFAERLAERTGRPVLYVATLEGLDDEMRERISRHRAQRPRAWRTVEAPLQPARALAQAEAGDCVLLDCLSLWVSNRLLALGETPAAAALAALEGELERELDALLDAAAGRDAPTIIVTNEVGAGVVPPAPLGRAYRDLLGRANQRAAARAAQAWLLVAGRALELPPGEAGEGTGGLPGG